MNRAIGSGSIGILGGTFDPVHLGHLRVALEMQMLLNFDALRFVPVGQPPHRAQPVAPMTLRLQMLQTAMTAHAAFVVDERELHREGPSYSVDTLSSLRDEFPGHSLVWILGSDAFASFTDWHRWEDILTLAHLAVAVRPGTQLVGDEAGSLWRDRMTSDPEELFTGAGRVLGVDVTQLEISSSQIRAGVLRGEDPQFLVTEPVRNIILESGCYAVVEPRSENVAGGLH